MKEIFRQPKEFNKYRVSNLGRVISYHGSKPKEIKPILMNGYHKVTLYGNNKRKDFRLQRLVAELFINNPNNKPQVNHIDGNKLNNTASNLEWVTQRENSNHASDNGLLNPPKGENHVCAKLSRNDVLDIRNAHKLGCFTQKEISYAYNVHIMTISDIISRKNWKHL